MIRQASKFWTEFETTFLNPRKLDRFINVKNICLIGMKRSTIRMRDKLIPKKFYKVNPRSEKKPENIILGFVTSQS